MISKESIPTEWDICSLGDYIYLKNGFAFKSNAYVHSSSDTVPIIRISDINGKIASDQNAAHVKMTDAVDGFEVRQGDLLIAMSGATTGKVGIYIGNEPAYQNQRVGNIKLICASQGIEKFRSYLISSLSENISDIAYGGAQPNISGKAIEAIKIGLPSLAEQKQIATKLDELLTQVDTIKTRLDAIPTILKRFRQSVLAAAVSGKLTEESRGYTDTSSWEMKTVGDLAVVATGKTPKRSNSNYWNGGTIPWLTSAATGSDFCYFSDQFVTDIAVTECTLKLFPIGTILLAMYGEGKTRGQVTELKIKAACNQACAALLVDESKARIEFVKIRLKENYEEIRKAAVGGNQPNLNLQKVREIPIALPSLDEQNEIVSCVERLFGFADQIEKQVTSAQTRINNLTQSILAKAFRGELTAQWREQNPDLISGENSAEALLKKIKEEREKLAQTKAKKKSVKKKAVA